MRRVDGGGYMDVRAIVRSPKALDEALRYTKARGRWELMAIAASEGVEGEHITKLRARVATDRLKAVMP
jgi:hypothetical protein